MRDKTVFITGGNTGIGKATAKSLAEKGADIVIMCRNKVKGEKALQEIQQVAKGRVDMLIGDLADFASIRNAVAEFKANYQQLDILINNAGMIASQFSLTKDGFEQQIGVNHFGHFLLTHLLMDNIKAAPAARIINVASTAHYSGSINMDTFQKEIGSYNGMKAYAQSKFANVIFTRTLAKRLVGTNITVNSLHPGVVSTEIGLKNTNFLMRFGWSIMRPFLLTAKKGARTSIYLASSPKVEGVTGRYFDNMREKKAKASDEALEQELWDYSMKAVGL